MSLLSSSNYTNISSVPQNAFNGMFRLNACIKNHPQKPLVLPATTLAEGCYQAMFFHCTGLTIAPTLPATTLANGCYSQMFKGCTGLTIAPTLPATTLVNSCYEQMFEGCTGLSSVTCLATDISANVCTYNWLDGVASSGTFTKAASMDESTIRATGIPSGWTVVDYTAPQQ